MSAMNINKVIALTVLVLSQLAFAQKFPVESAYSPTYQDVVVLYDITDRDYLPYFFQSPPPEFSLDQYLKMKMHKSCEKIKVQSVRQNLNVVCISYDNNEVVVGTLTSQVSKKGFYEAYQVNWNHRAELVQTVNSYNRGLDYLIVVK